MSKHKHHIIPKYRCKELGIDPDFDENFVMVERIDHALIHWGYKCDDLEPLFKYVIPPQWMIDLIPRGDNRDIGAAVITARGELDGLDVSGENNQMWKGGIWANDPEAWHQEKRKTPEYKANKKEHDREYKKTPEYMAYQKAYQQTPKYKAYKRKRDAECRARRKAETGYASGFSQAKNKVETQGEGTL